MMVFQLMQDKAWKAVNRGFRRKNGKVVWTDAVMSKDGRHRVRVSRKVREKDYWFGTTSSRMVVAYFRPHTEVELVPKK